MDKPQAHERAHGRPEAPRPRSTGANGPRRPSLVDPGQPAWRATAERLNEESLGPRATRTPRAGPRRRASPLAIALLVTVWVASPAPASAWVAVAAPRGRRDGQDPRPLRERRPAHSQDDGRGAPAPGPARRAARPRRLARRRVAHRRTRRQGSGARPRRRSSSCCAVLGRRPARKLPNHGQPRERCLFIGDERSYDRLRAIFDRHELPAELVGPHRRQQAMTDGSPDVPGEPQALLEDHRRRRRAPPDHRAARVHERDDVRAARGRARGRHTRVVAAGHARGRGVVGGLRRPLRRHAARRPPHDR